MARVSRKKKRPAPLAEKKEYFEKVFRCAAYVRLSSEEISPDTNCKLDNQEEVIKNFVKHHAELQVVKVYRDNGCTGTNFERDSFKDMIEDVKGGMIDCIIVKDLSRLGRNHIEAEQYIGVIFPFLKVRFIAVNDNFDSNSPDYDLTITLKNIINDAYAKDISRKIFSAKQTQRRRGEFVGNLPPYGYEKSQDNPHKLVVNQETGKVIKQIFDCKERGMTNTEIAKLLNEVGETAPMTYWYKKGKLHHEKYANRVWEATTIKVILGNQVYAGDMVQGKKQQCIAEGRVRAKPQSPEEYVVVRNTHEALVDTIQFEKVQKICKEQLEKNQKIHNKNKDMERTENLLENKVYSGGGLKMYRSRNVYENYVAYNYVTVKTRKPDGSYFPFSYVSEKKLLSVLEKTLYMYIEVLFSIQELCVSLENKSLYKGEREKRAKRIYGLEKEVSRYAKLLASLYREMSEGDISITEYQELRAEYQKDNSRLKRELEEVRGLGTQLQNKIQQQAVYMKEYKTFLKKRKLTKHLIDILVNRIVVVGKGKIEIEIFFVDEVKELYRG